MSQERASAEDSPRSVDAADVLTYCQSPTSPEGKRAVEALLCRYRPMLVLCALRILRDPERAEDIAQETLLRAVEKITTLRDPGSFGPWLRRMVRNASINAVQRSPPESHTACDFDAIDDPRSQQPSFDEERRILQEVIASMRPAEQFILRARYLEQRPIADIAASMDIAPKALKQRLYLAKKKLHDLLARKPIFIEWTQAS